MKQVQSLVKRTLSKKDQKKKYVVGQKFKATSFGKNSRYFSKSEPTSWSTPVWEKTHAARSEPNNVIWVSVKLPAWIERDANDSFLFISIFIESYFLICTSMSLKNAWKNKKSKVIILFGGVEFVGWEFSLKSLRHHIQAVVFIFVFLAAQVLSDI